MPTTPMARYHRGNPARIDYNPGSNYLAGDVIVLGNLPCVAHEDNPQGTGVTRQLGSLSVFGAEYVMAADGAYSVGSYVYWDTTNQQVTQTQIAGRTYPFGWILAGPTLVSSDAGPALAADLCLVLHDPGAPSSSGLPNSKYTTAALSGSTASQGQLTGANIVNMNNSGANPGTYTTRTAAQMFADIANCQIGFSYTLVLCNGQATGTLTLAGGTGVTITGTATVAANVFRVYQVTFTSATAVTFTNVGSGTAP